MKAVTGFTLIEVLVAMAIFAVLGVSAHQMLRTMIDTHQATRSSSAAYGGLVRTFTLLDRDFSQLVQRPVRDEYGETLQALQVGGGQYDVEFTRTGWNNPAQLSRSSLQRVAYSVEDEKLSRHFWLVLDRAEDSEPISQVLLDEVSGFTVNLLDDEGDTVDVWPVREDQPGLPGAVEVTIETTYLGTIRKVFTLTAMPKAITHVPVDAGGDLSETADPELDGQTRGNER